MSIHRMLADALCGDRTGTAIYAAMQLIAQFGFDSTKVPAPVTADLIVAIERLLASQVSPSKSPQEATSMSPSLASPAKPLQP